ncbi:hypothetical protein [Pedobacter faecalis]|uniref:hypothetical protein n=1 Tax=Pedobacter faecalis TaxID=3041495 RepID=UPI00254D4722|nr:hypothetical protein [Pedobacter sp. ELA7]
MNKASQIILTGVGGTTAMTAGSELMSLMMKDNYSEPDHLEKMISRLAPFLSSNAKKIAGWGAHYAMGFVFAAVFVELWQTGRIKCTFKDALVLGAVAGVFGLLIWKGTFKLHPLPPRQHYVDFYIQRIPAHIVYTVFAALTYRFLKTGNQADG